MRRILGVPPEHEQVNCFTRPSKCRHVCTDVKCRHAETMFEIIGPQHQDHQVERCVRVQAGDQIVLSILERLGRIIETVVRLLSPSSITAKSPPSVSCNTPVQR